MTPEEQANQAALATGSASPEPARRLSWWRVGGLLAVLAALAAALVAFRSAAPAPVVAAPVSSFAPYVDVTVTPQFAFEDPYQVTAGGVVLGFVVSPTAATSPSACQPSWGGVYSLDAATGSIDLDRRIARVMQRGGQVTASFGGAANAELAIGCTDTGELTDAYSAVVTRYGLTAIDFDIEGPDAGGDAVNARRAAAVRELQQARAAAGHPLAVWLTLPVSENGLTDRGLAILRSMLTGGVKLTGVNAMTMDFPDTAPRSATMGELSLQALGSLQRQLVDSYRAAGTPIEPEQAWQRIGATPMIGQNDVAGQRFELADAQQLADFAKLHHLARLSMWSANRDQACGVNYANPEVVSNNCSGVNQQPGGYGAIFNTFGASVAPNTAARPSTTGSSGGPGTGGAASMIDDPDTSPYPIWNAAGAYPKNTKIVWHRNVYEAKWWTEGDVPDAPVSDPSSTPWVLIGPVLPGEKPAPPPTLSQGTYPDWDPLKVYVAGQRVQYDGVGYLAKWWTQGQQPVLNPLHPSDTPWQLIQN